MKGIQYLVNDNGEKIAVQIDLNRYSDLWEDFYDSIIARNRVNEPRESFDFVREKLRKQGKLDG